jgi:hypothetical protein
LATVIDRRVDGLAVHRTAIAIAIAIAIAASSPHRRPHHPHTVSTARRTLQTANRKPQTAP